MFKATAPEQTGKSLVKASKALHSLPFHLIPSLSNVSDARLIS